MLNRVREGQEVRRLDTDGTTRGNKGVEGRGRARKDGIDEGQ